MRPLDRITTAAALAVLIAGPPGLAAAWARHQHWQPPTPTQLSTQLDRPPTAGMILAALAATIAAGWLALIVHLLRRAARAVTGWLHRRRHLPLPTPGQLTAGSIAGVAALTMPSIAVPDHTPTTAAATMPPPTTTSPPAQQPAAPDGIELPGSWIPYPAALAVSAVAAAIWAHRRHHYQPPPPGTSRDGDLQPLPGTAEAITAAVADLPDTAAPSAPPALLDDWPPGVISLTGPGATAAARAILISAALHAATHPTSTLRAVLHRDDLHHLLPDTEPATIDGLQTTGHPAHPVPTGASSAQPTILLFRTPVAAHAIGPGPATTVILGDTPTAHVRWHVDGRGATTGTGLSRPRRLCLLDEQAATDLLALLATNREHPTRPPQPPPATAPPPAHPGCRLTLLGRCELAVNGQPVHLNRSAGLQLLAYLAIHPGGADRTTLISAIWPGLPPATITGRLYTTLSELRKQLHPTIGGDPILRHDYRYQLNTTLIDTDLATLRQALRHAGQALTATQRRAAETALTHAYPGDLANGHAWPWLHRPRETLHRDVIDAYRRLPDHTTAHEPAQLDHHVLHTDPIN